MGSASLKNSCGSESARIYFVFVVSALPGNNNQPVNDPLETIYT